jgi:ATP-binding cassette subfamily B protein
MSGPGDAKPVAFWAGMRRLYAQLSRPRERQLRLLFALLLLNAIAELGTIGAVVPLLALIAGPDALQHSSWLVRVGFGLVGATPSARLIIAAGLFSAFAVASGLSRLLLVRTTYRFGYDLAHELTHEIQRRLLLQPYIFHAQRNTSTLVSALDKANILVFEVLLPLLQAASAAVIALFVAAILITVSPILTVSALVLFTALYLVISASTSRRLAANSKVISRGIDERLKIVQESLGGIRDVIVDGSHAAYLDQFDRENLKLGRARASTLTIATAPRFLIETAGMIAIVAVAVIASRQAGGFAAALPALGALALGAQRLLPLVQQIYRGWSTAAGHLSVIGDTIDLLSLPVDEKRASGFAASSLHLRDRITVDGLGFTYPNRDKPALHGVGFDLPAGSALALVGATGSGKSTLSDLLMGLLEPAEGRICVDGVALDAGNRRQWQRSVAHVPQSIFLTDASIAQNIALSLPDRPLDPAAIADAARKAQLHDFVMSLREGYDTPVGERGIRLSGGQRQRLGIARAIYKDTPFLILDEATSALDEATERAVLDSLEELRRDGRTILIIAHRPSTIANCDLVATLDQGRLIQFGSAGLDAGNRLDRQSVQPALPRPG